MSACSICLEPELREPAACIPCGHTFCHGCITAWINSQSSMLGIQFGPRKCPQCRVSIGGVQKLYLSEQPIVGAERLESDTPSYISSWQQIRLCLGYIVTHLCLTFQLLKQVIVKKCQDIAAVTQRIFVQVRQYLWQCQATLRREWNELSDSSHFWIFAAALLIIAFIVQDIQQERGVYACIISPMIHLVFHVIQCIVGTAAFVVFRIVMVLVNCGLEIVFGFLEMVYSVLEMFALVLFDFVCVPWVLLTACVKLISALICGLFGFIQRVVTSCLICLTVCLLVSTVHEEWKNVFRDLALTTVDWVLRQLPEERVQGRGRSAAESSQRGSELWQSRLAELLRAAMVVLQRELRRAEEGRREQAVDARQ